MKNLLSKIVKPLLIPILALSMNLKNVNAQKLEFKPEISFGGGAGHYSNFKVYNDWQNHFKGLDEDEELKYKKIKGYFELEVGGDLGISFNDFSFGVNSKYSVAQNKRGKTLSAVELHNWDFDYAMINEVTLKQKTPSLGVYFNFSIDNWNKICLRGSARKVEINEVQREDVYFSPELKCAPVPEDNTDFLTREFERKKYKTLLNKMGIEWQSVNEDGIIGLELYYETDWKKVHELGLNLNIYFNIPEKNKD